VERISALHTLAARSGHLAGAERVDVDRSGASPDRVIANLIIMIGAVLAGGGLWLLLLGGTPYYLLSGTAYVVSGVLLWRRRQAGAWFAVALLAATLVWAIWDAGLNYWAVSTRLFLPAGLAFMALLATLRFPANKSWRAAAHTAGVLGLLIGIQFAFAFVPHRAVHSALSRPLVSAEHSAESSNAMQKCCSTKR
jgi:glucose dehydrogenase